MNWSLLINCLKCSISLLQWNTFPYLWYFWLWQNASIIRSRRMEQESSILLQSVKKLGTLDSSTAKVTLLELDQLVAWTITMEVLLDLYLMTSQVQIHHPSIQITLKLEKWSINKYVQDVPVRQDIVVEWRTVHVVLLDVVVNVGVHQWILFQDIAAHKIVDHIVIVWVESMVIASVGQDSFLW